MDAEHYFGMEYLLTTWLYWIHLSGPMQFSIATSNIDDVFCGYHICYHI